MRPMRVLLLIAGVVAAFVGAGLGLAGGVLLWGNATQRDDDGYYQTSTERFESPAYAIASEGIDLGGDVGGGDWLPFDIGTARIVATAAAGAEVFVGIAPTADVNAYLEGTSHDELDDVDSSPFEAHYRSHEGTAPPTPPGEQPFWAASAEGPGAQTATWDIQGGEWSVVLMNADGSPGVAVDASAGVKTGLLLAIGLGLAFAGAFLLLVAVVLLLVALRPEGRAPAWGPGGPPAPAPSMAPPSAPWGVAPPPVPPSGPPAPAQPVDAGRPGGAP